MAKVNQCDRCGKIYTYTFNCSRTRYHDVYLIDKSTPALLANSKCTSWDLCDDCQNKLDGILDYFISGGTEDGKR